MNKQILAIAAILVILLSSCEDEINSNYVLSDVTSSYLSYQVGDTWSYDVSVDKDISFSNRYLITDTIMNYKNRGFFAREYDLYTYVEKSKTYYRLRFTDTLEFKDSIYLLGKYIVFKKDIIVNDSVEAPLLKRFLSRNDTVFYTFNAYYQIDSFIPSGTLKYVDDFMVENVEEGTFTNEMRNTSTQEQYIKSTISSSLNPTEQYIDLRLASSSGLEYFKHQIQRRQESILAFEVAFKESVLDTTKFDQGSGVSTFEKLSSPVNIGGTSYSDVTHVKTSFDAENENGVEVTNFLEYWIAPGGGFLKIANKTNQVNWTIK